MMLAVTTDLHNEPYFLELAVELPPHCHLQFKRLAELTFDAVAIKLLTSQCRVLFAFLYQLIKDLLWNPIDGPKSLAIPRSRVSCMYA